ncbi:MAG: dihydroorotase, partial [Pseudomonadota bacterium]
PCGCAGCFTAPVALPLIAQVFEEEGALDRLEGFLSLNGAAFYGLAPNPGRLTLARTEPWRPETAVETAVGDVTVFDPGFPLTWRVEGSA